MKLIPSMLASAALLATSHAAFAQPVKRLVTAADISAAGRTYGFGSKNGQLLDGCDMPIDKPQQVDLNSDGSPELIFVTGTCDAGFVGWFGIATRAADGKWRSVLEVRGPYELLSTRTLGWRDIGVGLPGPNGDQKFRWNGRIYQSSTLANDPGGRARDYARH